MEEKIKEAIESRMDEIGLLVDSIKYGVDEDDKTNTLYITLDSKTKDVIDVKKIVEATKIINPIIDKLDLIKDEYTLDVSSKERGNN